VDAQVDLAEQLRICARCGVDDFSQRALKRSASIPDATRS
jgi:hypothetical protein